MRAKARVELVQTTSREYPTLLSRPEWDAVLASADRPPVDFTDACLRAGSGLIHKMQGSLPPVYVDAAGTVHRSFAEG